jgi:hypothetical protein
MQLLGIHASSNDNGQYSLDNIPAGQYWLNATLSGYPGFEQLVTVDPETITWMNFTFNDPRPVPSVWGYNKGDRKVLIKVGMADRIKVDSNFTLTSTIPLSPQTVSSDSVKILDTAAGSYVKYSNVVASNNNLNFMIYPSSELKYDTVYQIIYGKAMRTVDDRELFWKDHVYAEFSTVARRPLQNIVVDPPNKAVNVPIDKVIVIEFPVAMDRASVLGSINASFQITNYSWTDFNMTLILGHEIFEYFTAHTISLTPGMISVSGVYSLLEFVNVSFTTISGIVNYDVGPFVDSSGKAIEGASIVWLDGAGEVLRSSITNDQGFATFYFEAKLAPGNYTLQFIKTGYKTIDWEITIGEDGEPINSEPPVIPKRSTSEAGPGAMEIASIAVVIVILVIILVILLYLVVLKPKHRAGLDGEGESEQDVGVLDRIFGGMFRSKVRESEDKQTGVEKEKPKVEEKEKPKVGEKEKEKVEKDELEKKEPTQPAQTQKPEPPKKLENVDEKSKPSTEDLMKNIKQKP